MKGLLASVLILICSQVIGQTTKDNAPVSGLEFQINSSVTLMNIRQKMRVQLLDDEGSTYWKQHIDDIIERGIGTDLELGYRFNNKWSAGGYVGAIFFVRGFWGFLPDGDVSLDAGIYGSYHFSDRFTLSATLGRRVLPNIDLTHAFGLSPEFKLGKRKRMKLRLSTEFFYSEVDETYSQHIYDDNYNLVHVHEGTAPKTTFGWMTEIGLAFTFGR